MLYNHTVDFMRRSHLASRVLLPALALALVAGCSDAPTEPELVGQSDAPIINGVIDTTHDAVVAVFSMNGACSGTIIHQSGAYGYVLTAAHCFNNGVLQVVVIGDNYQNADAVLNIIDYEIHPSYDANDPNNIYDFAMLRTSGATASTPRISVLTPAEDGLAQGTAITHLGYGLISYPNGSTSRRHRGTGTISQLAGLQFAYEQPSLGPCQGDSGGPQLVDLGMGERVAGVTSFGVQGCTSTGVSGRVSAVYNGFIAPFIATDPSTSAATTTAATSGTTGAGGSSAAATSGAGANGPVDQDWNAGNLDDQDYEGNLVTTGSCAVSHEGDGAAGWFVFALAAVALRRRRSA